MNQQNGDQQQRPELECTLNIEDYAEDFARLEAQMEADRPHMEQLLRELDARAEELLRDDADIETTVIEADDDQDDEDDDGEADLTRNWMHF